MSNLIEKIQGVCVVSIKDKNGKAVDSVLIGFDRPIFVGRDSESVDLAESIKAMQSVMSYTDSEILRLLEDSVILKLRNKITSATNTNGKKISKIEQQQIIADHIGEEEFRTMMITDIDTACEKYRSETTVFSLSKDEATKISEVGRKKIKDLHEMIL